MVDNYFSERYGYTNSADKISFYKEHVDRRLINRIWNRFESLVFAHGYNSSEVLKFLLKTWDNFLGKDLAVIRKIWELPSNIIRTESKEETAYNEILQLVKTTLFDTFNNKWYAIYDFIVFFLSNFEDENTKENLRSSLNNVFEEEQVPYRIIDNYVVPLEEEIEIEEINTVFQKIDEEDKFWPVKKQIKKALEHLSRKPNPDYENSIKESISAVEAIARLLTGEKKSLGKLINSLNIHESLKKGFDSLYGWTSDDEGIRHSLYTGEPLSANYEEARYMVVTCSAFINYLIEKYRKGGLCNG